MTFNKISIGDFAKYRSFFKNNGLYNDYYGSELNFQVIYPWQNFQSLQNYISDDYIIVKGNFNNQLFFLPPLAGSEDDFIKAVTEIKNYCNNAGLLAVIKYLNKSLKELLLKHFEVNDISFDRNASEYIYLPEDFIKYEGKKFHDKKNHLKQFEKYDFEIKKYTQKNYDNFLAVLGHWNSFHNESQSENDAIKNCLENFEKLNMICELIIIEGRPQAFLIGAVCENNLGMILFEKANIAYKGIYAAFNNYFTKNNFSNCKYLSMQDDMGDLGLRKSKTSYNPVFLEEKYNAVLK